ncbi:MAG TPA: S-methyl-5'-thioadenosine phosphorylase, partial [Nannocystaceae bacterium]|nr:S-methyl-5'-thioadenosine phosphorylase [Nannocystaceae bacterium]
YGVMLKEDGFIFDDGVVGHVPFADPTCKLLRAALEDAADTTGARVHRGGVYTCVEGPQFSTRAESMLYRSWGVDVIGMTAMPEAKLAREAELPFANLSLATDYDCWRVGEEEVSVDAVIAVLQRNVALAQAVVQRLATSLPRTTAELPYPRALDHAILTARDRVSDEARARLDLIAGHILG